MKHTNAAIILMVVLIAAQCAYASDAAGLNLPTTPVTFRINSIGSDAYINAQLSNVPSGFDVSNGAYKGWCANPEKDIYYPVDYTNARLYSSYDTSLPSYAADNDWDKVNYMINRFRDGAYSCATKDEIQTEVWKYFGFSDVLGNPNQNCMGVIEADVNANGDGYVPHVGDYVGIVVDNGQDVQVVFIEIPGVLAPEIASALAAVALASPAFGYLLVKRKK